MVKAPYPTFWLCSILLLFNISFYGQTTCTGDGNHQSKLSGELRQWHAVTLDIQGVYSDEACTTNPFLDYRMTVEFSHSPSGKSYLIQGYFAADGDAAETSATGGNIWRCHFVPDETGTWDYRVSFRTGSQIAISNDTTAGAPVSFDGLTGSFSIAQTNKTGRDFRAHGFLQYVGSRYLQFSGSQKYFIKGGADAPENLLAYEDFDNTPDYGGYLKSWSPHLKDWKTGDPQWQSGKGRELIGALNYLAEKGANTFSFLTMNINGDDENVFPYIHDNGASGPQEDRRRFDISKLSQWEIIFSHADQLGLHLQFKTQETENDQLLDGGQLGVERKLYYRELVARFSHHLGLTWNLGEENDIWTELNDPTQTYVQSYSEYLRSIDPYQHHISIHSYTTQQDDVFMPLLGQNSALTGPSIQTGWGRVHDDTKKWVELSEVAGFPWVVSNDEQGPAQNGVPPDPGYNGFVQTSGASQDAIRREVLWGNLMAGGAGVEYYFGYGFPESDLLCEDWRSRDAMWEYTSHALHFFQTHLPFWDMENLDDLVSEGFCFGKKDEVYAIYVENGTKLPTVDLPNKDFDLSWYDPRNGGGLQNTVTIKGQAGFSVPSPPTSGSNDWVVLFSLTGGGLPVELSYFVATSMPNGKTELEWETSQEINSSHFVIEASRDLVAIEVLGETNARGFSNIPVAYSFSTFSFQPYFRLKMIDLDGTYTYSKWVEAETTFGTIEVYPNPVSEALTLDAPFLPDGSHIRIYDIMGKLLVERKLAGSSQVQVDVKNFLPGLYMLNIFWQEEKVYGVKIQVE